VADLVGKGKHIRTVPMPGWVKQAVDAWAQAAGISSGFIFRAVSRNGSIWGNHITPKAIWHVVKGAARRAGIANLAPHDLRRSCARLVISPAENWSRFNSYSVMSRSRRPSGISAANRSCETQ
jgi:integrase